MYQIEAKRKNRARFDRVGLREAALRRKAGLAVAGYNGIHNKRSGMSLDRDKGPMDVLSAYKVGQAVLSAPLALGSACIRSTTMSERTESVVQSQVNESDVPYSEEAITTPETEQ